MPLDDVDAVVRRVRALLGVADPHGRSAPSTRRRANGGTRSPSDGRGARMAACLRRTGWRAAALAAGLARRGAGDVPASRRGDPAARLSDASAANEYWDLTARFESGDTLLVRFLITNQGPGAHTAVAQGYLILPDGRVVPFKNGREAGKWTLSGDRLAIDIGSSELELRGPVRRFAVDNDKRGVKIHLSLPVRGPALWSEARDGADDGLDLLQASGPANGTVWVQPMAAVEAMRGRAALTHGWMSRSQDDFARREIEFFGLGDETGIYFSELVPTSGAPRRWLAVVRGDAGRAAQRRRARSRSAAAAARRDYPLPRALVIRADGLGARIEVQRELVRVDPFDIVPQPLRFLLSLRSRPMRVWATATCTLTDADGVAAAAEVDGVVAITYVNPPDRVRRRRIRRSEAWEVSARGRMDAPSV